MYKRGIASTVFTYITAAIIMALLLGLGYRFFHMISEKATMASFEKFKTTFQEDVDAIKPLNTVRSKQYSVPSGTDRVCILDQRAVEMELSDFPYMMDALQDGSKDNVFLYKGKEVYTVSVSGLGVTRYPFFHCINVDANTLKIHLIGKANKAWVEPDANKFYCEIADGEGLCNALDLAYYEGYKDKCCERYSKCC